MENIIQEVRNLLQSSIDEKTASNGKKFFKEEIHIYGVKIPVVHKISKLTFRKIREKSKQEIFDLTELLWQSEMFEESIVACDWIYELRNQFTIDDFIFFRKCIQKYISNWATCDTFCNHTLGDFIMMYPQYVDELKEFARSKNRWERRAAAVSLIIPARKGLFLEAIFEIADLLLQDEDDLVRKAYGWMLKATSEFYQDEVYNYVLENKLLMPRVSLRYAIEKMPKEMRAKAMRKD